MRKALVLFCVSAIVTGSALADPEDLGGGVHSENQVNRIDPES